MKKILDSIEELGNGKYTCYKTRKSSLDVNDKDDIDYDDREKPTEQILSDCIAETDKTRVKTVVIDKRLFKLCQMPLFAYFLDGSRHVYKVDDIAIGSKIYPVLAGQIIVGCCQRKDRDTFKKFRLDRKVVICLPKAFKDGTGAKEEDLCRSYCDKINERLKDNPFIQQSGIKIDSILLYKTDGDSKFGTDKNALKDSGVSKIQGEMIQSEQAMVGELCKGGFLDDEHFLIKDGSLEYRDYFSEKMTSVQTAQLRTNYKHVVGISKMFNPDLLLDYERKKLSKTIANLCPNERTKVYRYKSGDFDFAIWYLRIRNQDSFRETQFSDVVKCEMIIDKGSLLSTDLVNLLSANLIKEAYPTCYGKDGRWGNHLYPVFLTESFCKSNYINQDILLNLF